MAGEGTRDNLHHYSPDFLQTKAHLANSSVNHEPGGRGERVVGPNGSCPNASNEGMVQSKYFMTNRAEFCSLWLSCVDCVMELVCASAIFC